MFLKKMLSTNVLLEVFRTYMYLNMDCDERVGYKFSVLFFLYMCFENISALNEFAESPIVMI